MITVYEIDKNKVFTGNTKTIDQKDGINRFWTRTQPPSFGTGQYAIFDGIKWMVSDVYPKNPISYPKPIEMRQFRLELNSRNQLQNFENALSLEENSDELLIEWEYAIEVKFDGVFKDVLMETLQLDDVEYKDFFKSASGR